MLWVDAHRPRAPDECVGVHAGLATHLKRLIASGDCPHLFFYGPSGSGKKTLALGVLRELYGAQAEKVKLENKTWKISQHDRSIEVELAMMSSNCLLYTSPSPRDS